MSKRVFFGVSEAKNKSTNPDLLLLREKMGERPVAGVVFTYAEIDKLLGFTRKQNAARYGAILRRYKQYLWQTYQIKLVNDRNIGYTVASNDVKADVTLKTMNSGLERIIHAGEVAQTIDLAEIAAEKRPMVQHSREFAGKLRLMAEDVSKQITFEVKAVGE